MSPASRSPAEFYDVPFTDPIERFVHSSTSTEERISSWRIYLFCFRFLFKFSTFIKSCFALVALFIFQSFLFVLFLSNMTALYFASSSRQYFRQIWEMPSVENKYLCRAIWKRGWLRKSLGLVTTPVASVTDPTKLQRPFYSVNLYPSRGTYIIVTRAVRPHNYRFLFPYSCE